MVETTLDAVTVLRARNRRLAKQVWPDGSVQGYDLARTFDAAAVPVSDLNDLWRLLARLPCRPDCAVVRGAPIAGERVSGVRRLVHADPVTGEQPTFRDVARSWLALDMDGLDRPANVAIDDLRGCGRVALDSLPAAFGVTACIVQATAGHGIKPGLRLRLWFYLDRPAWGPELRRWLAGTPCDMSVFSPVQLIYTASPIFHRGRDHLPERLARLLGNELVAVPDRSELAPPPRAPTQVSFRHPVQASRYVRAALDCAAGRIATAGVGQRHPALLKEASGLARFVHGGLLAEADLRRVLTAAARDANKHDATEVEACIAWGLTHPAPGLTPELSR